MNNQFSSKFFDMGRAIKASIGEIDPALRTDIATHAGMLTLDQTNQAAQAPDGLRKTPSSLPNAA